MIGKTIGKYRFVEELGRDGSSAVFKAIDETLDREVAVKVLNPRLSDTEVMRHFQAEATTLARLHHPDIVGIHEVHRTDSELLLVMELVRGETLEQLATRCGPLPPERAAYLVAQVLGALEHAHGAGVVHRDLKPANITVTEQGGIKVRDFGMARVSGEDDATSDGFVLASPAYMAPERLAGKEIDGRADVYSAGVIFYRLLTGHVPFEAPTPLDMVQQQLSGTPTPAVRHRSGLPGWCQAIIDRALARSPDDRFSTAEAFRATLLAAISEATESTGRYAVVTDQDRPSPLEEATVKVPVPVALSVTPVVRPATVGATPAPAVLDPFVASSLVEPETFRVVPPAGAGATVVLKKNQFAAVGGLVAVLVIGIIILGVVALRRSVPVDVSPSSAPASDTPVAASPIEPTVPVVEAPSSPPTSPPAAMTPVVGLLGTSGTLSRPSSAKPSGAPAAKPVNTMPFSFEAKAVVADGEKRREKDAVVTLADGSLTVGDKDKKVKVLYVVPLDTLVGLTYSKSKQPLWNSPDGPAEAMRVEGSAFGFLKGGDRNWFGLRTKDTLLVIRVDDSALAKVMTGLVERTGLTLERLIERKDP